MSKELKMPTKEQVIEASKKCPEVADTLETLFPEAFKLEEPVGKDITAKLKYVPAMGKDGFFYIRIAESFGPGIVPKLVGRIDAYGIHIEQSCYLDYPLDIKEVGEFHYFRILKG